MTVDWNYIQAEWDWAGHIVEALVMAAVVAVLSRALFAWRIAAAIGLAFAIGHLHGREKRDFEVSVQMPPPQLKGYYLWDWSWDQVTDFWPAALVCLGLLTLLSFQMRKRGVR